MVSLWVANTSNKIMAWPIKLVACTGGTHLVHIEHYVQRDASHKSSNMYALHTSIGNMGEKAVMSGYDLQTSDLVNWEQRVSPKSHCNTENNCPYNPDKHGLTLHVCQLLRWYSDSQCLCIPQSWRHVISGVTGLCSLCLGCCNWHYPWTQEQEGWNAILLIKNRDSTTNSIGYNHTPSWMMNGMQELCEVES